MKNKNNTFFAKSTALLKNFFFPPECVFCEKIMEINTPLLICDKCKDNISSLSKRLCCEKCGKPIVSHGKRQLCYFCAEGKSHYFDRIVSAFEYTDDVRDSIVRYKVWSTEGYSKTYADFLCELFQKCYSDENFDFICSAPPHTRKANNKGTDRLNLLCHTLSSKINIPFENEMLVKVRETQKQTKLSYVERLTNLKGAISVARPEAVLGKIVLLIDDVCTTRATIMECARALKAAGAKRVCAMTIATTVKNARE